MARHTLNFTLALLLVVSMIATVLTGETAISLSHLLSASLTSVEKIIVFDIRLPRVLIAAAIGAALGLAGAATQALVRNPLADPSIIGASQGAAIGAACVFYYSALPFFGQYAVVIAAFIGALCALALVVFIARNRGVIFILLAGLAINTLGGAALALMLNFAPNPFAVQELVFWLMGSVANLSMTHLIILLPLLVAGTGLVVTQKNYLLALTLGEHTAESMGFNRKRATVFLCLGIAILVGGSVAVAGIIGFIGLIVPHLVRPFVGHRPDRVLIPAALGGAVILVLADLIVQTSSTSGELKLGVITSLLGGPVFIAIVMRRNTLWPN